jgi:hypothetical protein
MTGDSDGATLRLRVLRLAIRERLKGVCAGWPPEEFDALVQQIAATTMAYDGRATPTAQELESALPVLEETEKNLARIEAQFRRKGRGPSTGK